MLRATSFQHRPLFALTTTLNLPTTSSHSSFFLLSFVPSTPPPPPLNHFQPLKPVSTSSSSSYLNNRSFPVMGTSSSSSTSISSSTKASYSSGGNIGGADREILVQHLLVSEDSLELLVELQKKIAQGMDLGDLATEFSICPSKEQGGMLGWVRKGQMVPEFEEAAFNAPPNTVTRCKTKFGWHLLQVLSEREAALLQDIEPEELQVKMKDPSFLEEAQLIDVREPEEVTQASLPGFVVLPLRQFGSWSSEVSTKFDPEKETYVLCHHGVRSLQVARWLQTQGFKRIFNVSGGIHAYAVKADPSVPTY